MAINIQQKKILIIDDEVPITEELGSILGIEGYQTVVAHNGFDAIDLFKKEKVDLILLDVKMPGLDGIETYAELRKIDPNVPVIVITGGFAKANAEKILKAGGKAVLYKPFSAEELLLQIKKYLIIK